MTTLKVAPRFIIDAALGFGLGAEMRARLNAVGWDCEFHEDNNDERDKYSCKVYHKNGTVEDFDVTYREDMIDMQISNQLSQVEMNEIDYGILTIDSDEFDIGKEFEEEFYKISGMTSEELVQYKDNQTAEYLKRTRGV